VSRGFTLVELIVALTLLTALVGGLFFSFGQGLRNWRKITAAAAHLQVESIISERICREVRLGAVLPASSSSEVFLKIDGEAVSYKLVDSKVRRKKGSTTAYLTDDKEIKRLFFSYPAAGAINITVDDLSFLVSGRNQ
jgi:prepilin-type N-terminal cleavage/methylation domain-containing protein